ncbi:hypothetical protein CHS0354_042268 [Potamilus streckersoni]|uniref:Uncharacterized protein n=1 Tax=Potamilus streckersoni TaxID=2493646 RepID=A0AAE0SU26_9BIVA|nr:hypothetical protein CHS0354_042268 [Potamilus streckersoni]
MTSGRARSFCGSDVCCIPASALNLGATGGTGESSGTGGTSGALGTVEQSGGECSVYLHGQCMPEVNCPMTHGRARSFCGNDVCCIPPSALHLDGMAGGTAGSLGTGGAGPIVPGCKEGEFGSCGLSSGTNLLG